MTPKSPLLTVEQAQARILEHARVVPETESLPLPDADGRVLAAPVTAKVSVPPLDNSAMDGYAVRVSDLDPAGENALPVSQRIAAGRVGTALEPETAARIFTGAPLPPGADAVVMQEHCREEAGRVRLGRLPGVGENVRRAGEDFAAGEEILSAGVRLAPQSLALAAAAGMDRLSVRRRLRVALLSTGDELVPPGVALRAGQIYDANRYALAALLARLGCAVQDGGHVADEFDATARRLDEAAGCADVVLTSGGVSVGEEDHVKRAVEQKGRLALWKVAMKPGKPLAFGEVGGAFFLGLPGNPVSAFVTFGLFVRPFLLACQGASRVLPPSYSVRAGFDWKKPGDRREYVRVRLDHGSGGAPWARLFPNQGSGVLRSLCWADGVAVIPEGHTVAEGDTLAFLPFGEWLA
jgi:molybdopterin molybdotransferase